MGQRSKKAVVLKHAPFECSFLNMLHWLIENFVMCKWQMFKNNPRANWLALRAFWCVTLIYVASFFLTQIYLSWFAEIPFTPPTSRSTLLKISLTYFAAWTAAYWKMSDLYRKQWDYCSNLYNQTLSEKEETTRELLRNSLAIDLVTVDLWAHRSFAEMFKSELELAVKYGGPDGSSSNLNMSKIENGTLLENDALELLEAYQTALFTKKNPKKSKKT